MTIPEFLAYCRSLLPFQKLLGIEMQESHGKAGTVLIVKSSQRWDFRLIRCLSMGSGYLNPWTEEIVIYSVQVAVMRKQGTFFVDFCCTFCILLFFSWFLFEITGGSPSWRSFRESPRWTASEEEPGEQTPQSRGSRTASGKTSAKKATGDWCRERGSILRTKWLSFHLMRYPSLAMAGCGGRDLFKTWAVWLYVRRSDYQLARKINCGGWIRIDKWLVIKLC